MQLCDLCHTYLREHKHQDWLCKPCNKIFHRTCAQIDLNKSSDYISFHKNTKSVEIQKKLKNPVIALTLQYNRTKMPAPLVLIMLTKELETQAKLFIRLDLFRLYRSPTESEEVVGFRALLHTRNAIIHFSDYTPQCISGVLKVYLRELQEPVIPFDFYSRFIEASKKPSNDQCLKEFLSLVNEMPEQHISTLKYLVEHFRRICRLQYTRFLYEPPTIMIHVMCNILTRPEREPDLTTISP